MSAPADGGSAFPVNTAASAEPGAYPPDPGMTLRDWFAGQALAGRMSIMVDADERTVRDSDGADLLTYEGMATSCFAAADAMLAERTKELRS